MNKETLKKAMPALDAFLKNPQSAEHFKTAMDMLQEVLDEEERFSNTVPMWHEIAGLPTKPHPSKELVAAWAQGKRYPENPPDVVQKIFTHLRKRGVENPEPTQIRRERYLAQQSMEMRSATPEAVMPAVPAVPDIMSSIQYGPLMRMLLTWQPVNAYIPTQFLQVLEHAIATIPRTILYDVVSKLHGYHLGTLEAWIEAAKHPQAQQTAWPSPEAQSTIVKQLIAFLIALEFRKPTTQPEALTARIRVATMLITETELGTALAELRESAYPPGSWNSFTVGLVQGITAGTLPPPQDPVLINALQKALIKYIRPHFMQGYWP